MLTTDEYEEIEKQHLFELEIFCYIIHAFFDQFKASLLIKVMTFFFLNDSLHNDFTDISWQFPTDLRCPHLFLFCFTLNQGFHLKKACDVPSLFTLVSKKRPNKNDRFIHIYSFQHTLVAQLFSWGATQNLCVV